MKSFKQTTESVRIVQDCDLAHMVNEKRNTSRAILFKAFGLSLRLQFADFSCLIKERKKPPLRAVSSSGYISERK